MRAFLVGIVVFTTAIAACSEAADLSPDAGEQTKDASGADAGGDSGVGANSGDAGNIDISDAATNGVVLNEVCGKGANWVEIYNATSSAADVTGLAVADSEKDAGGPKVSGAVTFPAGTVLSPNSYLIVAGMTDDAGSGCPDGGQSYCFPPTWGISNKEGESIYLLTAHGAIAQEADYPASTLNDGETWGRLPNGSGAFTTTAATPGATNKAP